MIFTEESYVHIKMFLVFLFKKLALYLYPEGHKLYNFYLYIWNIFIN